MSQSQADWFGEIQKNLQKIKIIYPGRGNGSICIGINYSVLNEMKQNE